MAQQNFLQKYWKIIVVILLVLILYPKEIGYGYGGELIPDQGTQYREEKVCLGVKYSIYGGPFIQERCLDCSVTIYCVGIPLQKKCYEVDYDGSVDSNGERETQCFQR